MNATSLIACPSCPPVVEARALFLSDALWTNVWLALLLAGSGRLLAGAMVAGWGVFNLVEGLIDHQLLEIHHVHPGAAQATWDWGFVIIGGAGLIGLGNAIARTARLARL